MVQIPDPKSISELYGSLMVEVKARLQKTRLLYVQTVTIKDADNIEAGFLAEYCYLHLRRISELLAIGVLAAHNEHPQFRAKDLVKNWNAADLMTQLAKLNPDAFPQKGNFSEGVHSKGFGFLNFGDSGHARELICNIYNHCGDKLHTGALKMVVKQRSKPYDISFVRRSFTQLFDLLDQHIVMMPDKSVIEAKMTLNTDGPVLTRWLYQSPR